MVCPCGSSAKDGGTDGAGSSSTTNTAHSQKVTELAERKARVDDDYSPTGSGRIPGSKYTITEVEINNCTSRRKLERLVAKHRGRTRTGCCGVAAGVLAKWKFISDERAAIAILEKNKTRYFPLGDADDDSGDELMPSADDLLLIMFLGKPGDHKTHSPPNPNAFDADVDAEERMLRFNRKKLIMDVYEDEKPCFSVQAAQSQKVTYIKRAKDAEIDKWGRKRLKHELVRRGYVKYPYNIKMMAGKGDTVIPVSIRHNKVVGPADNKHIKPFAKGLPAVRKMSVEQMRSLLKLIGRDPRFANGQVILVTRPFGRDLLTGMYLARTWCRPRS
eukprot:COSAG01_NODE_2431_length_7709_cov_5.388173_2_plen_331_part_00